MIGSSVIGELLMGLSSIPTGSCVEATSIEGGTVLSGTVSNSPRGASAGVEGGGAVREHNGQHRRLLYQTSLRQELLPPSQRHHERVR